MISNQFIDSQHISAINQLLSTSPPTSPAEPHTARLADNLESLTIKLIDFKFDSTTLIDSSTWTGRPIHHHSYYDFKSTVWNNNHRPAFHSSTSVSSSLSARYDSIDLSWLEKLTFLSITTPTRVKFGHSRADRLRFYSPGSSLLDEYGHPEFSIFHNNCLTSLEIDARLTFHPDQHLRHFPQHEPCERFNLLEFLEQIALNDNTQAFKLKSIKVLGDRFRTSVFSSSHDSGTHHQNNEAIVWRQNPVWSSSSPQFQFKNQAWLEPGVKQCLKVQDGLAPVDDRVSTSSLSNGPILNLNRFLRRDLDEHVLIFQKLKLQFLCWRLDVYWST